VNGAPPTTVPPTNTKFGEDYSFFFFESAKQP
jgi:hypothetical protein